MTQHELVRRLGVSRGTLHRVLTDSPLVKEATREKVLSELKKLNYTPNALARALKTRKTQTIGILGPSEIKAANINKLNEIYVAARAKGYRIELGYSDGSPEADEACIRELKARMVDGIIALGRGMVDNIPQYQSIIESGTPFISLYPIPGLNADCVYVDTQKAFMELVLHLTHNGHREMGILLDSSVSQYTKNRELGFRAGIEQAGLTLCESFIVRARSTEENAERSDYQLGYELAERAFKMNPRPTALVCFSDELAIGVLRAAEQNGVSVPSQIAIVGYDDFEGAKFARVPLTTMHQPNEVLAQEAVDLMIRRIEQSGPKTSVSIAIPASIVVRESCGCITK
ncbi:LacI family transcriptional regulator [Cerasicoccus arenae]|uniref:LacI family transcriptional regulator n=2 Tax=Cerasicoccus arenae TaxID=424488 RepID=A0A8J3DAP3_9BACT|nr:LacI family DNA-binding transcriptional regulator [Cerasicoccus arenae]GHC02827.1 LacI family transcriptional regulator [Cerasicoccus arenae]